MVTEQMVNEHGRPRDVFKFLDKPIEHLNLLNKNFWGILHTAQGASQALGLIGPEASEAVPLLIQALEGDEDWSVRSNAARALGWMESDASEVVPTLIQALGDESEHVRSAAADALGEFGAQAWDAIPALMELLADEYAGARSSAARALRDITGQDFGEDEYRWQQWWQQQ